MSYFLTNAPNNDINQIWAKVSRDSIEAADNLEAVIIENCELLARSPLLGRFRSDLTDKPLRVWPANPYRNYHIVYGLREDQVRRVRVIHTARRKVWKSI